MNTSGIHFSFLLYQSYLAGRNDWDPVHTTRDTTVERTLHDLAYALGEMDRTKSCMGVEGTLKKRSEVLEVAREYLQLDEDLVVEP